MTIRESKLTVNSKKPNTQIPVIFQNIKTYGSEDEDTRFLKIKIWLMHTGKNFNGSSFTKDIVNKYLHTLANTPILTFIEENSDGEKDFSDHRMVLHRTTEGGINYKYLGSAVGVIPEGNNARWETRVTDAGDELEYLVVDALMWTKWDDPVDIMVEKGFTSQSMELADDYSGTWDKHGVFHFESFSFFGACLLGEGVMPAMKDSTAEIQFSKNQNIQNTIENKMQEFYTLLSQEGGNEMTKDTEPVTPEKTVLDIFTVEEFTEAIEMNTLFNATKSIVEENPTTESKAEPVQEFALTAQQMAQQLRIEIGGIRHTDRWGDTCRSYWYVDHTDTTVIFENYEDGYQLYEANYALNGDHVEIQFDNAYKVKVEYAPFEGESVSFTSNLERFNVLESQSNEAVQEAHAELNENFTTLSSDYETLKDQMTELQTYKRQREELDIKAKFEGKLSDEEFAQVFSELEGSNLDKVEESLFALIGKKNFSIQKAAIPNVNKVKISSQLDNEKPQSPYGDIFEDEM